MKVMWSTEADMRAELALACKRTTQARTAKRLGFSGSFLCDVLKGRREVTEGLATAMGYQRVIVFQKVTK